MDGVEMKGTLGMGILERIFERWGVFWERTEWHGNLLKIRERGRCTVFKGRLAPTVCY